MSTTKCEICLKLMSAYDAAVKAYTAGGLDLLCDTAEQARQDREQLRNACYVAKHELHAHAVSDRRVSGSRGF